MNLRETWKSNGAGPDLGYAVFGDPEGFPVLFFHGWPGSRYQARPAHEDARRRGLKIISIDRPGIGLSGDQSRRKISDWPALIDAFSQDLNLSRFHLLAVSGGCPYALAVAAAIPEKVGKVAISCGAPPLKEFNDLSDLLWIYRFLISYSKFAPFLQYPAFALGKPWMEILPGNWPIRLLMGFVPPADKKAICRPPNMDSITQTVREAFRRPRGGLLDGRLYLKKWGFDYTKIEVPVAFWHGTEDRSLPLSKTEWLARQIPNATFEKIRGEGHYSLPLNHTGSFLAWLAM